MSRDVAEPLVFLNSDVASFLTGTQLLVDYGDETLKTPKMKGLQNIPVVAFASSTLGLSRSSCRRILTRPDQAKEVRDEGCSRQDTGR